MNRLNPFSWPAYPRRPSRSPTQLGVDEVVADPIAYQKEMLIHTRRMDRLAVASTAMVGILFLMHVCGRK